VEVVAIGVTVAHILSFFFGHRFSSFLGKGLLVARGDWFFRAVEGVAAIATPDEDPRSVFDCHDIFSSAFFKCFLETFCIMVVPGLRFALSGYFKGLAFKPLDFSKDFFFAVSEYWDPVEVMTRRVCLTVRSNWS
jgi:hypothetical protein